MGCTIGSASITWLIVGAKEPGLEEASEGSWLARVQDGGLHCCDRQRGGDLGRGAASQWLERLLCAQDAAESVGRLSGGGRGGGTSLLPKASQGFCQPPPSAWRGVPVDCSCPGRLHLRRG